MTNKENIFSSKIKVMLMTSLIFISQLAFSQAYSVSGKLTDSIQNTSLPGANVLLKSTADTSKMQGTVTDIYGGFKFENLKSGNYLLEFSYIGYAKRTLKITIKNTNLILKPITLQQSAEMLEGVNIEAVQVRAVLKGDTTEFNAGAFKTNPDATAEDLVKKMPGVTSDGSTVKVNGEEVKKVLVDGKQFFGDDPSATLKNLPAEIVDKVQVFDKSGEQAMFTGFSDGNEEKALNIITKSGKNQGVFGKVYGAFGTSNTYSGGLSLNYFNQDQRISLIGMSNNINQQNFSITDIMGVMSNSGATMGPPGEGGGSNVMSNFFSGFQNGNTKTHSLGLNYVDNWGAKISVTGSYFFNLTDNSSVSNSVRNYFSESSPVYTENSTSSNANINHRLNLRMEYKINNSNSLIVTPKITIQDNNSSSSVFSQNLLRSSNELINSTNTTKTYDRLGYNFENDAVFQHKFAKKGRTISFNLNTKLSSTISYGKSSSSSIYTDTAAVYDDYNEDYNSLSKSTTWGGNLSFTEPVGKNGQIMASVNTSTTGSSSEKLTHDLEVSSTEIDSSISNKLDYNLLNSKAGLSYRFNKNKLNFNVGADFQMNELTGNQLFPYLSTVEKSYKNFLPSAMLNYKFSKNSNIHLRYRSSTNNPTISQLQDVVDISNPLYVKIGNMNLNQSYQQNLMSRLGFSNSDRTKNFFVFVHATATADYITNATTTLASDTVIQGYTISKGSQLVVPTNVDGYLSLRSFSVYSFPVKFIKSTFNINGGYSFSKTPGLIDNQLNYSNSNSMNGGFYISSNISENLDFSVNYTGNYNIVKNSLSSAANSAYFNHTSGLKLNYIYKRLVINTDASNIYYIGLGDGYNKNYVLWNAYLGYKFLKNKSLELKISVNDILNQNQNITRTTTESYTEDSYTESLKRYGMLTLTYTIKKFKGTSPEENSQLPKAMPPPPANMPPPGGGH